MLHLIEGPDSSLIDRQEREEKAPAPTGNFFYYSKLELFISFSKAKRHAVLQTGANVHCILPNNVIMNIK